MFEFAAVLIASFSVAIFWRMPSRPIEPNKRGSLRVFHDRIR
jgi:hypothetical protein